MQLKLLQIFMFCNPDEVLPRLPSIKDESSENMMLLISINSLKCIQVQTDTDTSMHLCKNSGPKTLKAGETSFFLIHN